MLKSPQLLVNGKKLSKQTQTKTTPVAKEIVLLARILHTHGFKYNLKMGKNIYVQCDTDEFKKYETLNVVLTPKENQKIPKLSAYQILALVTNNHAIHNFPFLSFIQTKREKTSDKQKTFEQAYRKDWLYYASQSPIWLERIQTFKGKINDQTCKIVFENDDFEEDFYQHYGYEPDEQKKEVQEKSIGVILKQEISDFYKQYNSRGFFELEEEYFINF